MSSKVSLLAIISTYILTNKMRVLSVLTNERIDLHLVPVHHELPHPGSHVVVAGHGAYIGPGVQDGKEVT